VLLIASSMASPAYGQTQAPLAALVERLQANPGDDALRRQTIEQARAMRPPPAIPAEARNSFIQGVTITQGATDATGQRLAIQRFNEALRLAPWWGDAYYNRGVAQDLAGEYSAAIASLQLYLLTGPSAQERQQAEDRIAAIQGRQALAAQNAVTEAQSREVAFWRSIDGAHFLCPPGQIPPGVPNIVRIDEEYEVSGRTLHKTIRVLYRAEGSRPYGPTPYPFRRMSGERAIFGNESQEYAVDASGVSLATGSVRCPRQ
jgi:tetratricopeptide (TPR) repeat protein